MSDQYVADRMGCMDVMAKYAKGVDNRDLELYRTCFSDDVVVTGFGDETFTGGDEWTAYVKTALEAFGPTQHMMGPQLVDFEDGVAHCRTDVQAHHYMADAPDTTLTLWATYENDMKKIDGEWKIIRHHLVSRGTRIQKDQPPA